MMEIKFRNGEIARYKDDDYTDFRYDGKYFMVIRDNKWIGFYNLDSIMCILVHEDK